MATTKVNTKVLDDVAMVAGAGDVTTDGPDLDDGYGGIAYVKLTNGGTGPTIAAQVQIQVSPDDANWYNLGGALVGSVTLAVVKQWVVDIPIGALYIQVVTGSNTGQNVTVRVDVAEVTAIS